MDNYVERDAALRDAKVEFFDLMEAQEEIQKRLVELRARIHALRTNQTV